MNQDTRPSIRDVVIIDDSRDDAEALSHALKGYGVAQIRCYTAPPDMGTLAMDEHSLIVLDLILGKDIDGLQVLEQMAAWGLTKTPIFLVTGLMGPLLDVAVSYGRARGLTIVGSVEKPVRPSEIAKVLSFG